MAWELHSLCRAVSLGFLQWCWISAVHDEWQAGLQTHAKVKNMRNTFQHGTTIMIKSLYPITTSYRQAGFGTFQPLLNLNMDKEPLSSLPGQNKSLFTAEPPSHTLLTALCTCSFKLTVGISLTEIISEKLFTLSSDNILGFASQNQ